MLFYSTKLRNCSNRVHSPVEFKAIAKKLNACWGFLAQSQLAELNLTSGLVPCQPDFCLAHWRWPSSLLLRAGRLVGSVVGGRASREGSKSELRRRDQIWVNGKNSKNLNLMLMGLRERDCYWTLEGICFETTQENHLPWIYANKAHERTTGESQPCLFLYDFVYRLYWDF